MCLTNLVFVNVVRELCLAEFVEGYDDQGHEDVDKEEGEDDKVDDVVDGHLRPEPGEGPLVLVGRGHRVLQNTAIKRNE